MTIGKTSPQVPPLSAMNGQSTIKKVIKMSYKILFMGDSITDANRNYNDDNNDGCGYATMIEGYLNCNYPFKYEMLNRGIGGHKLADIYSRMQKDIIHVNPDFMSILVGVNDVWHEIDWQNGTPADSYEKLYDQMISEIKERLPKTKLMIIQPYVVKGVSTLPTEQDPERWNKFRLGVDLVAAAAKRVAEKHGVYFLPLQLILDEAQKKAPSDYWTLDGVHPSAAGHELIKNEWLAAFGKITGEPI